MTNSEFLQTQLELDESMGSKITLAALLGFLSIPGIVSAKDIASNLDRKEKITYSSVNTAMNTAATNQKTYGGYTAIQVSNIVARTLFMEARSDYKNNGLQAVASVIWNRAGGKPENLVKVCWERRQFSVWKADAPWDGGEQFTPKGYKVIIPKQVAQNKIEAAAWEACKKWAGQMVEGTFTSNIGNRNMYDYAASGQHTVWWDKMQNRTKEGEFGKVHIFGYLPERDGFAKPSTKSTASAKPKSQPTKVKTKSYKIKEKDTLYSIAQSNNTTVDKILAVNKGLNAKKLKIGSEIQIPV